MAWPDLVIIAIAILAAVRGFRRGFVKELGGAVALGAALVTPWFYNGSVDGTIESFVHLGPGSAHVIGMAATGIVTYVILIALSFVLDRIARLPILGIGNSIAGAAVGLFKAALLCWFLLYVALFFPLSPDIRTDLHRSQIAPQLTQYDPPLDKFLFDSFPWFARPFVEPYFKRHHA